MARRAQIVTGATVVLGLAALLYAERRWPSRPVRQAEPRRTARNLALGAASMVVVSVLEKPLIERLTRVVEQRRRGLAQQLPAPVRGIAAFLLLDWAMYGWHVATHRVPFLWRLHRVHHVDQDMDATTALRFHFADMIVSLPFRIAQVAVAGADPRAHQLWQSFFFASVLLHHSRVRLPKRGERLLSRILTTPGMHDIHHRADITALDSNWSSGLSLWDHLHGTFRDEAPDCPIGVPRFDQPLSLPDLLTLPFAPHR
jgi:sterol desaturase/sphingolipid hydroxylase (fatty acid hydroxylase superfamily)